MGEKRSGPAVDSQSEGRIPGSPAGSSVESLSRIDDDQGIRCALIAQIAFSELTRRKRERPLPVVGEGERVRPCLGQPSRQRREKGAHRR